MADYREKDYARVAEAVFAIAAESCGSVLTGEYPLPCAACLDLVVRSLSIPDAAADEFMPQAPVGLKHLGDLAALEAAMMALLVGAGAMPRFALLRWPSGIVHVILEAE